MVRDDWQSAAFGATLRGLNQHEPDAMTIPKLLPTTVVGSYPPPEWLVDRERLTKAVARNKDEALWRVPPELLAGAQDDATRLAVGDMEAAGVDIVTDGEIRRESYGTRFALSLEGVDADKPGEVPGRSGKPTLVPRIVGPIKRRTAAEVRDAQFLRSLTGRGTKLTLPGPFTLMRQMKDEYYGDQEAAAMAIAEAINGELKDIKAAGIDVVQLDEPWMQSWPSDAGSFGLKAINRALEGVPGPTVVHVCFGYAHVMPDKPKGLGYAFLPEFEDCICQQVSIEAAQPELDLHVLKELPSKTIMLGVLDLAVSAAVETPELVAARIEKAFAFVPPERLVPAPDCGMKYMKREVAFGKLKALAGGAALARQRLGA
jgi:5-methyltetrahydropteroyltriglutamate--homocysteine methyltransferase